MAAEWSCHHTEVLATCPYSVSSVDCGPLEGRFRD